MKPEARGLGASKALLWRPAQRCWTPTSAAWEGSVLNWNTLAIELYGSQDAAAMEEGAVRRLYGEALQKLAESCAPRRSPC